MTLSTNKIKLTPHIINEMNNLASKRVFETFTTPFSLSENFFTYINDTTILRIPNQLITIPKSLTFKKNNQLDDIVYQHNQMFKHRTIGLQVSETLANLSNKIITHHINVNNYETIKYNEDLGRHEESYKTTVYENISYENKELTPELHARMTKGILPTSAYVFMPEDIFNIIHKLVGNVAIQVDIFSEFKTSQINEKYGTNRIKSSDNSAKLEYDDVVQRGNSEELFRIYQDASKLKPIFSKSNVFFGSKESPNIEIISCLQKYD